MGGDFTYQDALVWYKNLDKLIKWVEYFRIRLKIQHVQHFFHWNKFSGMWTKGRQTWLCFIRHPVVTSKLCTIRIQNGPQNKTTFSRMLPILMLSGLDISRRDPILNFTKDVEITSCRYFKFVSVLNENLFSVLSTIYLYSILYNSLYMYVHFIYLFQVCKQLFAQTKPGNPDQSKLYPLRSAMGMCLILLWTINFA